MRLEARGKGNRQISRGESGEIINYDKRLKWKAKDCGEQRDGRGKKEMRNWGSSGVVNGPVVREGVV